MQAARFEAGKMPPVAEVESVCLRVKELRYGYAIFDALIIASALRADSNILWSEDLQDGMVIDGRLRIANPFRGT